MFLSNWLLENTLIQFSFKEPYRHNKIADYLLSEVYVSSDEESQDDKLIDPITQGGLDFINDDDSDVNDTDIYCSSNK